MKFHHLAIWRRWQTAKRHARQQIKSRGVIAAAEAMFDLNRHARDTGRSEETRHIYHLKTQLIQLLYESGLCRSVEYLRQDMPCWECMGDGVIYDEQDCGRCDGSGIYQTHFLYKFTFYVDGQSYVWHQPAPFVTWPVRLTLAETYAYMASPVFGFALDYDQLVSLFAIVYEYIASQGVKPNFFNPSLIMAIQRDMAAPFLVWRDRWRWRLWLPRKRIQQRFQRIQRAAIMLGLLDEPKKSNEISF